MTTPAAPDQSPLRAYPKRPRRPVDGVLVLDKALHQSSNRALQRAKGIFAAQKAGHTGTLDPLASGVLVICFGQATKFSQYMLDADKVYEVEVKLGQRTTTGDCEGEVTTTMPVPELSETHLASILEPFRGTISQTPPMHSALKVQGQPLYKLARKGKTVDRPAREITIHKLELLSFDSDVLNLRVACSKGTYIRTLAEDIGEALGCGAHVTVLRRTQVGPFTLQQAYTLEQLRSVIAAESDDLSHLTARLLGCDALIDMMPTVQVNEEMSHLLLTGRLATLSDSHHDQYAASTLVRLYAHQQFIGIGEYISHNMVKPKRMFVV